MLSSSLLSVFSYLSPLPSVRCELRMDYVSTSAPASFEMTRVRESRLRPNYRPQPRRRAEDGNLAGNKASLSVLCKSMYRFRRRERERRKHGGKGRQKCGTSIDPSVSYEMPALMAFNFVEM